MKELVKKLTKIQKELKAPKSQFNKFGNYKYRNQEDILEAVKPLLGELVLTVSDEVVAIGNRIYIKATINITDGVDSISNTAYAREAEVQKGMNEAQITGSASSYARKYALNGLFLIDDTKDDDSDEVTAKTKGLVLDSEPKSTTTTPAEKTEAKPMVAVKPTTTSKWAKPKTKPENGDLY
jgi:hypothetical protein